MRDNPEGLAIDVEFSCTASNILILDATVAHHNGLLRRQKTPVL
ncbi:hypothetical protein APHCRT_0153 [Anaplasma phagocytophilum str. CRT53-1]|uniref:Uncharacterized protein n=1 Tax=Anaplasma phagocytophilum str. CRT53-1 TaxID=1359157 RepID=A0A0F3Q704_ANAPH|nr:hypothetical protein APHCRT_0153 [Anaplasma phagocytophilum str. CRT53-1]